MNAGAPHFWDFLDCATASVATVQAKARKGWRLCPVSQGFGAAGGTASYHHALVGPAGELLKVSGRTVAAAEVTVHPEALGLNMSVLLLAGVRKDDLVREAASRGLARTEDLGARWNGERRCWMVRPEARESFKQWVAPEAQPVPMFPSLEGS